MMNMGLRARPYELFSSNNNSLVNLLIFRTFCWSVSRGQYTRFQVESDFICKSVQKMQIPWTGKQMNIVQYDELAC